MSDPLDAVFVTGTESAELKRAATARALATYLERMPAELRAVFGEQFQHVTSAELAQLRAIIDALENDIICAFCGAHYKADDVPPQHYMTCEKSPLVQRIAEQALQLEAARYPIEMALELLESVYLAKSGNSKTVLALRSWLAANPATLCTCGMGDATMPELHAKDCALLAPQQGE